ncbi:MAG: hypothetical protein H8E66_31310 [Planctomycetes bacterium]|nr:hypothetical protein [Planctomycetota bacterium]
MNLEHLKAILWLRWRMSSNQWRRLGKLNAVITMVIAVGALIASFVLFFAALIGGSVVLITQKPGPDVLMLTWDVVVLLFLFVWTIGLVTELQRSELLSLDRLLHLPLSLASAFFLNYATSLLSFPVLVFLPGMTGLAIACVVAYGFPMLVILPLLASFMFFVTALTYQLRGWLATLMENKRRRKSIIVAITLCFIALVQAPQILNMAFMGSRSRRDTEQSQAYRTGTEELTRLMVAGEITPEENSRRMKVLNEQQKQGRQDGKAQFYNDLVDYVLLGNKVVPFGWFPYGVRAAATGTALPAVLASIVMFGVGSLSLWRSYVTTLRFYTGTRPAPKKVVNKSKLQSARKLTNGVDGNLPFLSEHITAVSLASFRSLLRAPESKMALMTPIILVSIFGGMLLFGPGRELRDRAVDWASSFIAISIIGVMLFGLAQLTINIFGMDRGGFRAFVLMPVRRHELLIGKNLSVAPIAASIAIVLIIALQCVFAMPVTHLLATLVQLVPSYLLFCLAGNSASILAPMAIASGSLKPAQPSLWPMLIQMFFMLFAPLALLPAIVVLGAETALTQTNTVRGLPIYLVFSIIEAALVLWIYRAVVKVQGDWLQRRETRMLETLSKVPE